MCYSWRGLCYPYSTPDKRGRVKQNIMTTRTSLGIDIPPTVAEWARENAARLRSDLRHARGCIPCEDEDSDWDLECERVGERALRGHDERIGGEAGAESLAIGAGPQYFGLELELEWNEEDTLAEARATEYLHAIESAGAILTPFGILKSDGSLGVTGMELATVPMNLATARQFITAICPCLREMGWTSHRCQSCGFHVHASRAPLTSLQIGKMLVHVNANRALWTTIAGRSETGWAKFTAKRPGDALHTNGDRYEAVNLRNGTTVEFRIFKGTLSAHSLIARIEAVAALIAYCRPGEQSIKSLATSDAFLAFLRAERKTYPALWAYCVGKDLVQDLPNRKATATATAEGVI